MRIDLDHNATTRPDPEVVSAMIAALRDAHGNPSSIHAEGRQARERVERARREVASWIGGSPFGLIFTSGGTEADCLGVVGGARAAVEAGAPRRVVVSAIEHPAVHAAAASLDGFEVVTVGVDGDGRLDEERFDAAIAGGAALVSIGLANHELGNVVDVAGIVARAHARGALVHTDAVQAMGKLAVDVAALGVDLLSLSAHKFHGPKGVGALWVRPGAPFVGPAGGGQERGRRPGTENVAGIVGLGAAAALARSRSDEMDRITALRDRLEAGVLAIEGARVNGDRARRVGNTTNVAFAGAAGDLMVMALDLAGVSASTGAACTSGSVAASPVVLALGQPVERAAEAVRFSLGRENTAEEIDRVLALLPGIVERIRHSA